MSSTSVFAVEFVDELGQRQSGPLSELWSVRFERAGQVSARRGLIVSGQWATGKSTAIKQLGRAHELLTRKRKARVR